MKKFISIFLVVIILCLFTSCIGKEEIITSTEQQVNATTSTQAGTTSTVEGSGGTEDLYYTGKLDWQKTGIDGLFMNYVSDEEFNVWAEKQSTIKSETEMMDFVKDFNISKEKFIEINKSYNKLGIESPYTDKQIDAIYSGSEIEYYKAFISPYAICVGDEIYTPEWLATHSTADYKSVGISAKVLNEKILLMKEKCITTQDNINILESKATEYQKSVS